MKNQTQYTNIDPSERTYNRNAWFFDLMSAPLEHRSSKRKKALFNKAQGKILEVGVGAGANIPYYPDDTEVVGIDISDKMLLRAEKKARKYNKKIVLEKADVQNLNFPDDTFDTVVSTCGFCSVTDPVKGLEEVRRVLKDDGQLLMIEHVKSKNKIIGKVMEVINPYVVKIVGANINRDTISNIKRAGLKIDKDQNLIYDILKFIKAKKSELVVGV